jgi:hypothetical protein
MSWYSVYGTGANLYAIERTPDDRVEFTVWLSVLWMPIIPISSWSAVYAGETIEAIPGESHAFADLRRIPHKGSRLVRTFLGALALLIAALAPMAFMIERTEGRAATTLEMVIIFGLTFFAAGLIIYFEIRRGQKLKGR